jgi:hypothetical protein
MTPKQHAQDRYVIVSRDWQKYDRRYVVVDTRRDAWVLQTNDFARAVEFRDAANDDPEGGPVS